MVVMANQSENVTPSSGYSAGAVARMTGVSAHLLRAWERRYGAVTPARTAGGTRRYSDEDVERLRLLRAVVDAGHAIGDVAGLPDAELERRIDLARPLRPGTPVESLIASVKSLEAAEVERSLSRNFASLGAKAFTREVLVPFLHGIGDAWERGELTVAAEHLASSVVRNLLGVALNQTTNGAGGEPILFTTPSEERHEMGTLVAALHASAAGARAIYLGPDLPADALADAARRFGARAVAVGMSSIEPEAARSWLSNLRDQLPDDVGIWIGGARATELADFPGAHPMRSLEELENHVSRAL